MKKTKAYCKVCHLWKQIRRERSSFRIISWCYQIIYMWVPIAKRELTKLALNVIRMECCQVSMLIRKLINSRRRTRINSFIDSNQMERKLTWIARWEAVWRRARPWRRRRPSSRLSRANCIGRKGRVQSFIYEIRIIAQRWWGARVVVVDRRWNVNDILVLVVERSVWIRI